MQIQRVELHSMAAFLIEDSCIFSMLDSVDMLRLWLGPVCTHS